MEKKMETTIMVLHVETSYRALEHFLCGLIRKTKHASPSFPGIRGLLHKSRSRKPRPSSYPLLGPKYLLLGTIYTQLRVQGGSWKI